MHDGPKGNMRDRFDTKWISAIYRNRTPTYDAPSGGGGLSSRPSQFKATTCALVNAPRRSTHTKWLCTVATATNKNTQSRSEARGPEILKSVHVLIFPPLTSACKDEASQAASMLNSSMIFFHQRAVVDRLAAQAMLTCNGRHTDLGIGRSIASDSIS
jgi:hypothetical protein